MHTKPRLMVVIALVFLTLIALELSSVSFVNAAYRIHQNHTLISIQSPASNGFYVESSVALVINVNMIYGTTTPIDEFSFQNLTCSYSLDNGEWKNITAVNVTSNKSQPDMNYWYGLLHRLNITYRASMQNLSDGLHSINITLNSTDSWHTYQDTSQVYFTINTQTNSTPIISSSSSPTQTPTLSPSPTPEYTQTENWTTIIIVTIVSVVIVIGFVSCLKRTNNDH